LSSHSVTAREVGAEPSQDSTASRHKTPRRVVRKTPRRAYAATAACRVPRRCANLCERRDEVAAGAEPQRPAPNQRRAIGSAGERLVHTEEVTGSIPVSPTDVRPGQKLLGQLSSYSEDGSCCRIGRNLGGRVLYLLIGDPRKRARCCPPGLTAGAITERREQTVEQRNGGVRINLGAPPQRCLPADLKRRQQVLPHPR
jgi:hypothetical protein